MKRGPLHQFEQKFVRPKEGRTLIVGSKIHAESPKPDRRKRYANAVGIDMHPGKGVDYVCDLEEPLPLELGTFDHVECMSVLEHSRRPWLMAANIERLMAPGATIFLTVPWVWRYHPYDHDYFRMSHDGIASLFHSIDWKELRFVSDEILPTAHVNAIRHEGHPYLARTETCGFGVRR